MCTKLLAFVATGSPTLFAETVHSAADVINQVLLKVGEVKAQAKSTERHPFGFGKERYFWALVSSISVLFLGCGASVRHGIEALLHETPSEPFSIPTIALLMFAGCLEAYTFHTALREIGGIQGLKGGRQKTTILAVLLEDAVALIGIALTLFVAFWSRLVGPAPNMDAGISIGIGLLLGVMALALARLNKEVLIDVSDISVNQEVARVIEARSGIHIDVASSLIDADRCLLFVRVAPQDIPQGFDFARLDAVGELIKQEIAAKTGKAIDQVYWQFPPGSRNGAKT
jgi:zinc transporter 9